MLLFKMQDALYQSCLAGLPAILFLRGGVTFLYSEAGNGLLEACECGDYNAARSLIEAGVDVDYRDGFGNTALFYSALRSHVDVMRLLLANEADVGATNLEGSSPIIAAVLSGKLEPVQILLLSGASPGVSNDHGYTPLKAAEDRGLTDIATLLRAAGATE